MATPRHKKVRKPSALGIGVAAAGVIAVCGALAYAATADGATIPMPGIKAPPGAASSAPQRNAVPGPEAKRPVDHLVAIDQSLSVRQVIGPMKAFVRSYVQQYVAIGDRLTLIGFSFDNTGEAREIITFDFGPEGAQRLERLLDDIKIQSIPGQSTMTLYRPLRDLLDEVLRTRVVDSPRYLVISDRKSDGVAAKRRGLIDYDDISFDSLGRATYEVPNARGWWVAVGGGQGVDYTALFAPARTGAGAGPATPTPPPRQSSRPVPVRAIADCLLEPEVYVSGADPVVLKPDFWKLRRSQETTLRIAVHGECVTRRRELRIFARGTDGLEFELPPAQLMLGTDEQQITVPLELSLDGEARERRQLRIVLSIGEGFSRTVAELPIQIERRSWLDEHGMSAGLGGGIGALGLTGMLAGVFSARKRRAAMPEYVRIAGGNAVALRRGVSVDLGGQNCSLIVPGAEDADLIARLAWNGGQRGRYVVEPEDGWTLKTNGVEGANAVGFGLVIEATHQSGRKLAFSLAQATAKDIGRSGPGSSAVSADPFDTGSAVSGGSSGDFVF